MDKNDVLQLICSRGKTDIFDLLYETCIPCATLKKMLGECVSEGELETEDGINYIHTGKNMPPAGGGEEKSGEKEKDDDTDIDSIFEEILRELEAEESESERRRRNELGHGIRLKLGSEDLDDNASKADIDRVDRLISCMKESVYLETKGGEFNVGVRGLSFPYPDLKISSVIEDGALYLSDKGKTLAYLSERADDKKEFLRKAEKIAGDCGVEVAHHGVLRIEVRIPDLALAVLVRMYEAIDRLLLLAK